MTLLEMILDAIAGAVLWVDEMIDRLRYPGDYK